MSKEQLIFPHEEIYPLPSVTVDELYKGNIPSQKGYESDDLELFYLNLALHSIALFVRKTPQTKHIIATAPLVKGKELTYLFHFAAPSKFYGVDYIDTQMDWNDLYNNPSNKKLLKRHRNIKGWKEYFEPHRERYLHLIEDDYSGRRNPNDFVIPVIQLQEINGSYTWDFGKLSSETTRLILQNYSHIAQDDVLQPTLGALFVAAYSPQITQDWGEYRTYIKKVQEYHPGSQNIGSTQVFPLTTALAPSLLASPVVINLIEYVDIQEKKV